MSPEARGHVRFLLRWVGGAVAISILGTFLAYNGPLSSGAWQAWSGAGAWKRDAVRVVVGALVALFLLFHLRRGDRRGGPADRPEIRSLLPRGRFEWVFFVGVSSLLLWLIFVTLPASFAAEVPERFREIAPKERFAQIRKPYFPYLLYVFGFWYGLVWPVFVSLVRCVRSDWRWRREARARVERAMPREALADAELTRESLQRMLVAFQANAVGLKSIAERYVPVLLSVVLILLYEQLTPSHETITQEAVNYGKLVVWALLGPSLVVFVSVVALGYQAAVKRLEEGLRRFVEGLAERGDDPELLDRAMRARTDLMWSRSPAAFLFSVVKSADVAITLMLTGVAYLLHGLTRGRWVDLLLPNEVVQLVRGIFE